MNRNFGIIKSFALLATMLLAGSLSADSVKINQTGTTYENVKTSVEKGVVTVDFEDGSQKRFRTRDVTVTTADVVWLAQQEEEEVSFFERIFSPSEEEPTESQPTAKEDSEEKAEDEESIPYLGEGIFGGVAFLFLVLP